MKSMNIKTSYSKRNTKVKKKITGFFEKCKAWTETEIRQFNKDFFKMLGEKNILKKQHG